MFLKFILSYSYLLINNCRQWKYNVLELFCQKGKHVISYPRKLVCYCRYDIHFIANVHKYQNIFKRLTPDIGSWLRKTILMLNYWPSRSFLWWMSMVWNREIRNTWWYFKKLVYFRLLFLFFLFFFCLFGFFVFCCFFCFLFCSALNFFIVFTCIW